MKLQLSEDWSEFLRVLIAHRVRFVLIGGHAVAAWGEPRFTEDLDVLIETSPANARRVRAALVEFGFGTLVPDERVFLEPDKVWMLGRKPNRIDLLTKIDGVTWDEVWKGRVRVQFGGGGALFVIGPTSCWQTSVREGGRRGAVEVPRRDLRAQRVDQRGQSLVPTGQKRLEGLCSGLDARVALRTHVHERCPWIRTLAEADRRVVAARYLAGITQSIGGPGSIQPPGTIVR